MKRGSALYYNEQRSVKLRKSKLQNIMCYTENVVKNIITNIMKRPLIQRF